MPVFLMRLFLLLLLILLGAIAAGLFMALDKQPLVTETMVLDNQQSARAERLMETVKSLLQNPYSTQLSTSQMDLNSAFALLTRAHPRIVGRTNISRWGMLTAISLKLPVNSFPLYLNLALQVNPSTDNLDIEKLQVGDINIPGNWVSGLLEFGLDHFLGDNQGAFYTSAIRGLAINGNQVTLYLHNMQEMTNHLKHAGERLEALRDSSGAFGNPVAMAKYYRQLLLLAYSAPPSKRGQLSYFIGPTMKFAKQRTAAGASAVEENHNAILTLGLAFGGGGLEKLIGKKRLKGLIPENAHLNRVVIAGRGDLVQHYLVSAALKIIADSGFSYAVGEYKELLDSNRGGSGFSFADLAADRAGVRLAEVASLNEVSAQRLQDAFQEGVNEFDFFPSIIDLPEGISDSRFKREYGSINSRRYRQMQDLIDRRINLLPVIRGS